MRVHRITTAVSRSGGHSVGFFARPSHNLYLDRRRRASNSWYSAGNWQAAPPPSTSLQATTSSPQAVGSRRRRQLPSTAERRPGRGDSNIQRECQRPAYDPNRLRQFPLAESVKLGRDDHLRGSDGRHAHHCRKRQRKHSAKRRPTVVGGRRLGDQCGHLGRWRVPRSRFRQDRRRHADSQRQQFVLRADKRQPRRDQRFHNCRRGTSLQPWQRRPYAGRRHSELYRHGPTFRPAADSRSARAEAPSTCKTPPRRSRSPAR